MSKTIRRKHSKPPRWVLWDWSTKTGYMQYAKLDPSAPKGRRAIARFHSDAGWGERMFHIGGSSKPYRIIEIRKYRAKCQQALHKFRKGAEDCILPTYKHDWID